MEETGVPADGLLSVLFAVVRAALVLDFSDFQGAVQLHIGNFISNLYA